MLFNGANTAHRVGIDMTTNGTQTNRVRVRTNFMKETRND